MKKTWLLTIACLLLLAIPAAADFQIAQWQFYQPLTTPQEGLALIELDKEVLKHSRPDFADLRLVSEQGQELPFHLSTTATGEFALGVVSADIINQVTGQNFTSFTFNIGEPTLTNQITLDLDTKEDFFREVILEGSSDNKTWSLISKDKIFSVGTAGKDTELRYADVDFRLLRVTILNKDEKPLIVNEARLSYAPVADKDFTSLPVTLLKTEQVKTDTIVDIDLGVKGYNLDHLELQIDGRNYHRRVEILHSYDAKEWLGLATGTIYQQQWSGHQVTHTSLAIKENCGRYLRLIIHNLDSPPLMVQGVDILGRAPRLLVDLPAGKHQLWYGNPEAKMPNYDVEQFSHLVQKKDLPVIALGGEQVNENYTPKEKPWTERNRWLLNAVVILVALLLGGAILKNMRAKG